VTRFVCNHGAKALGIEGHTVQSAGLLRKTGA
jgi:hypothetical protein